MSIIYTVLSKPEVCRLTERDHSYLKQKLKERGWFSQLMHRPVNRQLLHELQCLLDRKPIPRRKSGQGEWRLSDGKRHSVTVRKVSAEEMERLWGK